MGGRIMAITINADTSSGLSITSDTSGEINFQSGGSTVASITSSGIDASGLTGTLPAIDGSNLTGIETGAGTIKAWGNFSGTNGTINASGNVSSVTDNGTGDFTANYTTSLSDANYSLSYSGFEAGQSGVELLRTDSTITSSSVNIKIRQPGATGLTDCDIITFVAIR